MSDANFLAKECRAETEDEQHAAEYQRLARIVNAEHRAEWVDEGGDLAEYTAHGNRIHKEVVRRMKTTVEQD